MKSFIVGGIAAIALLSACTTPTRNQVELAGSQPVSSRGFPTDVQTMLDVCLPSAPNFSSSDIERRARNAGFSAVPGYKSRILNETKYIVYEEGRL